MAIDVDLNLAVENKNIDIITSLQYYVIPAKAGMTVYIVFENNQTAFISSAILKITTAIRSA